MSESLDDRIAQIENELAGLRRQKLAELQAQMLALQRRVMEQARYSEVAGG